MKKLGILLQRALPKPKLLKQKLKLKKKQRKKKQLLQQKSKSKRRKLKPSKLNNKRRKRPQFRMKSLKKILVYLKRRSQMLRKFLELKQKPQLKQKAKKQQRLKRVRINQNHQLQNLSRNYRELKTKSMLLAKENH